MKAQITLTVAEGKRIIAEGIVALPQVKRALRKGKIFLKGGTTVSAIAELLTGKPLRISGRINPTGTRAAKKLCPGDHNILIKKGKRLSMEDIDESFVEKIGKEDIFIVGANALDIYGNAAIMNGRAMGGTYGRLFSRFSTEAGETLVAVGLEKLVPGRIQDIIRVAKRKGADLSMGVCVGLMPVTGRVVSEVEAIETLAPVKCTVIGKGGVGGAEGGLTLLLDGPANEVERLFKKVWNLKGTAISGIAKSLEGCDVIGPGCPDHYGCIYSRHNKKSAFWRQRLGLKTNK